MQSIATRTPSEVFRLIGLRTTLSEEKQHAIQSEHIYRVEGSNLHVREGALTYTTTASPQLNCSITCGCVVRAISLFEILVVVTMSDMILA